MDFKNFEAHPAEANGVNGRPPGGGFHLARQGSIYALTFDELQNTMGSIGKDFGSMNMDELLKSIWSAEEIQTGNNVSNIQAVGGSDGGGNNNNNNNNIQRQGSLTLPRTLSQKTVDEVWKDISKEFSFSQSQSQSQPNVAQRQQTLGEMTLEEFLVKAGVVREEANNSNGLFSNLANSQNSQNTPGFGGIGFQASNLPLNVNGVRSGQNQQLFPKQSNNLGYGGNMTVTVGQNSQNAPGFVPSSKAVGSAVVRNGVMGVPDPVMSNGMGVGVGVGGMVGLGGVTVGSPAVSSDGVGKNNGEMSSVSPSPYEFSGIVRGRRSGTVEKVVERRQRRMIKNRESAARSRARKQAYTMELEAEVAKLKEQNQELKRKAEMMEKQQNQVIEMMSMEPGAKRRKLRKTLSGPW